LNKGGSAIGLSERFPDPKLTPGPGEYNSHLLPVINKGYAYLIIYLNFNKLSSNFTLN
jgi:hypothetical protein